MPRKIEERLYQFVSLDEKHQYMYRGSCQMHYRLLK